MFQIGYCSIFAVCSATFQLNERGEYFRIYISPKANIGLIVHGAKRAYYYVNSTGFVHQKNNLRKPYPIA